MFKSRLYAVLVAVVLASGSAQGQEDYGSRLGSQRGGSVSFEPQGPGVMFGALDPSIKKWYIPQELALEYGWRQWEYSNYAKDSYQRYVNTNREGDYFYDFYGNFIGRGWLIYDWSQNQPQQLGSSIFEDGRFNSWFNSLTIGSDSKGQYHYSIMVGTVIRTTLTPMTFSKPRFNGVQIDFMADKYAATILASRVSEPIISPTREAETRTNATTMFAGRGTVQLGDFIEVGATLVDARNANTTLDLFSGDPIAGSLTAGQSSTPLTAIAIVLSDDSPEDGEGGAALFRQEMRITSRDFETNKETVFTLQEVVRAGAEWPITFGGFQRSGFLAADGAERIVLNYDFNDPAYIGPDPTSIVKVDFEYVLANDFKVDMWSDRQTGQRNMPPPPLSAETIDATEPALLTMRRAEGNVQDISNLQLVKFDYGLPTGNLVGGFTIEGTDVLGFDFYAEWDRNKRYFQYPNAARFIAGEKHKISSEESDIWFVNLSKKVYPWFVFGEAYSLDPGYSTSAYLVDANGDIQYDNPSRNLYEFVDDNDDQDQFTDWLRFQSANDRIVFPGWDENNDFISDFNQNDNATFPNAVPDYDEPFLRYAVDRPEFLFGIDLNNNNYIDRFEDDDLADYPYKVDREGYNVFAGVDITPEARLILGRTDEKMLSEDRENRTQYALFSFDRSYPGLGRFRVFEMVKKAEDTIPDNRRQPSLLVDGPPVRPEIEDILPAQDTWINSLWIGFDYKGIDRVNFINKFKYDLYHQNAEAIDIDLRPLRENSSFLGLINKVDYMQELGIFDLQPKFKSEYRRETLPLRQDDKVKTWTGTFQLLASLPVLQHTVIQSGVEQLWHRDLIRDEDEMVDLGLTRETGDQTETNVAVQLSNISDYLGYRLTTQIGLRFGRNRTELVREADDPGTFELATESNNVTTTFITVYAGIQ
ncbi:MAG: hypothetical protein GKR89_29930 [Candidatus Latescibacteria bacterium]|nr:hypothetical protein [Candidatus Latescibacterota bacterium]